MHEFATQETVTLRGQVIAVDWDGQDNVTEVAIEVAVLDDDDRDFDEYEEFVVANDELGSELLGLVDEFIEARVTIDFNDNGEEVVYVQKYRILDDDE